MAEGRRKVTRGQRGTPSARGQQGRAARIAEGGLSMEMERKVVEAARQVRQREKAVVKAQAKLKRVVSRTGGAGLRLKDLTGRPGGLSLKVVR